MSATLRALIEAPSDFRKLCSPGVPWYVFEDRANAYIEADRAVVIIAQTSHDKDNEAWRTFWGHWNRVVRERVYLP